MAVSRPPTPLRAEAGIAAGPSSRPAALLGVALLALCCFAAAAGGATAHPADAVVWIVVAITGLAVLAATLLGPLRARAPRAAWAGVALLGAFAAWSALSLAWSVAPDRTWAEANRAVAYATLVVLGIVLGSSLPRSLRRVSRFLPVAVLPVALFALGGKVAPGLPLPGLELDHAGEVSRLRAPVDYWNALALLCVIGLLPTLRLAAATSRARLERTLLLAAACVLVVVLGLTYSRGGVAALAVGLAVTLALTPDRRVLARIAALTVAGAAPPLAVAFTSSDLTTDGLALAERTDDGLLLGAVLLASLAMVAVVAGQVFAREGRPVRAIAVPRRLLLRGAWGVAIVVAFALGMATPPTIGDGFANFTEARQDRVTDPARLLSTNSGNRWLWWQEAVGAWSDRPLAGWGAGSFAVLHLAYRENELPVRQPHSVPLQFLAETGFVGALLALGGLGLLGAAAVAGACRRTGADRAAAAVLTGVLAAWAIHGLVDWDWDIPAVTVPVLVVAGVLAAHPASRRPPRDPVDRPGRRGALLGVGTVVAALAVLSAALPAYSRSAAIDALVAAGTPSPAPARLDAAAATAARAARVDPLAVLPLFATAAVAERRGRPDAARAAYLEATRRQPGTVETWTRLARFEFDRGDYARSSAAIGKALELDPRGTFTRAIAQRLVTLETPSEDSPTATGTPLPATSAGP